MRNPLSSEVSERPKSLVPPTFFVAVCVRLKYLICSRGETTNDGAHERFNVLFVCRLLSWNNAARTASKSNGLNERPTDLEKKKAVSVLLLSGCIFCHPVIVLVTLRWTTRTTTIRLGDKTIKRDVTTTTR